MSAHIWSMPVGMVVTGTRSCRYVICQSPHLWHLDDVLAIGNQQPVAFQPDQPLDQQLGWMMWRSATSEGGLLHGLMDWQNGSRVQYRDRHSLEDHDIATLVGVDAG